MKKIFLIVLGLFLLGFGFSFVEKNTIKKQETKSSLTYEDLKSLKVGWEEDLEKKGIEESYEEIKANYQGESFIDRHNVAHYFGELLYENGGSENVVYCDDSFAWGCFHGLFIKAVSAEGMSSINEFYEVCKEKESGVLSGCQHGIGHGALEYVGHNNLKEALDICWDMEWNGPLGCAGGAYMEYFLPGWFGARSPDAEPKEIDEENPASACLNLPNKYQESCLFRAGEWWGELYDYNPRPMETFCSDLDESLQPSCYQGIGSSLTEGHSFSRENMIDVCTSFSTNRGSLHCRVGASWRLLLRLKGDICESELCRSELSDMQEKWPHPELDFLISDQ